MARTPAAGTTEAKRASSRGLLTWRFKLPLDDRLPVARPLGIWMIGAKRGGPLRLDLPVFRSGLLEAPLLVQHMGVSRERQNGVRVTGPEHTCIAEPCWEPDREPRQNGSSVRRDQSRVVLRMDKTCISYA